MEKGPKDITLMAQAKIHKMSNLILVGLEIGFPKSIVRFVGRELDRA
jgi:hypothetical protein